MLNRSVFKLGMYVVLLLGFLNINSLAWSQEKNDAEGFQLYKVYADAAADLNYAKAQALKEKKHVLVFVGGNWCVWCKRLDAFLHADPSIEKLLDNYKVVHINYSKQNKNEKVLATLNNPQENGFPVIVLLDEKGNYMFTQSTDILEQGSGYDKEKVSAFLNKWTYKNINNKK